MACDCLEKIEDQIKKNLDPKAEFEHCFMDYGTGLMIKPSPLRFKYHKKKADDTFEKKMTKSFVAFSHCPFCGTRYKTEADPDVVQP